MAKILILFAHPAFEKSRVHARLIRHLKGIPNITFNDLYEAYPDFDIDVQREKDLLLAHDVIVWQHPFYWYSGPAIIKQWLDLVLEHGWAYGPGGDQLKGKRIFQCISSGGSREAYRHDGRNRLTVLEYLAPFEQTAKLCQMQYLPPFVIHGTHRISDTDMELCATQYEQLLVALGAGRIEENEWRDIQYLNDLIPLSTTIQS